MDTAVPGGIRGTVLSDGPGTGEQIHGIIPACTGTRGTGIRGSVTLGIGTAGACIGHGIMTRGTRLGILIGTHHGMVIITTISAMTRAGDTYTETSAHRVAIGAPGHSLPEAR